jgi:hypothetical protein
MQALHYTRWFTKASISGQKKRTKQQQQTNKQIQRLRTHQNAAGDKRPTREIHGVTEFRVQSRDTVREREIREIKRRIYVRERERYIARAQRRIQNMFRQKTEKGIKQREIYII